MFLTQAEIKPDPLEASYPPSDEDTDEETDVRQPLTDTEIKAELNDDENGSVFPGASIEEIYEEQPSAGISKRKGD